MHKSNNLYQHRTSIPFHYYSITTVSNQRAPIFSSLDVAQIVIRNLYELDRQNITKTICYVLMPDHIHWLFQLQDGLTLAQAIQRFKGRSAREVNVMKGETQAMWQKDYFEHQIRDENDLIKQARYIIANPLRCELVTSVGDYPYWNCIYL